MYGYTVSHVKGIKNHLADMLSRRPVWLNPDHTLGPDEGLDLDDGDDFAMRDMESKPHLLRDNSLLKDVESIGSKDPEYYGIIHALRTGSSNKSLSAESEARKIGGEWDRMSVMDEAEVVCISGDDGIDMIYPPKAHRKTIIELLHKGGKHLDIVMATCVLHYRWPKMKQDI